LTIWTLIPVSWVNGCRLAAIAAVGAVFSEMKLIVVPAKRRHLSSPGSRGGTAAVPSSPQPASNEGAARAPAPSAPARRKPRRL
jgi:hypothetical protein